MKKNLIHPQKIQKQKGATLFVTVILVLVLSIVALAVYQQASFDERNARAQADRQLAVQAAEIALRDAEYDLQCQQFSSSASTASASSTTTVIQCSKGEVVKNRALSAASAASAETVSNDQKDSCRSTCVAGSRLKVDRLLLGFDDKGTNGLWAGLTDTPKAGIFDGTTNPKPWEKRQNWAPNANTSIILGRYTGTQAIPIVAQQPRYLIEGFTDSEKNLLFRITAKGWGRNPTTEVTLQQTYRP